MKNEFFEMLMMFLKISELRDISDVWGFWPFSMVIQNVSNTKYFFKNIVEH